MRGSLTSTMVTPPRARGGATRRSHAARPRTCIRRPRSSTRSTWSAGVPLLPKPPRCEGVLRTAAAIRELLVRLDDLLDELVAHDVAIVEVDERDPLDRPDDLHRLDQPGRPARGQIDLGDVAGDNGLGAEAEAGEEHLHLLRGRVLRLVEDDERVV